MLCVPKIQSVMATPSAPLLLLFLSLISLSSLPSTLSASGSIAINYGRVANDLPSPPHVVQLLKAQGLTKVKLYDTDSTVLSALSGSGISVTVALPNELLSSAAAGQSYTDSWVQSNIFAYYPKTLIEAIAVGNEVFVDPKNTTPFLVPAMKNVYSSLVKYNVSSIKISSPIALSALQTSYPSSSGSFQPELVEPVIKPMLNFLKQTGSYVMVNAYPFFAYTANTDTISLDYALFRDDKGVTDPNNGLVYKSLFEAQLDAVFAAMNTLGFNDVKVVVSETGWPSKGDENEVGASQQNAAAYNGNLVRRVLTSGGTPLRPDEPLNVYLFALFNENQKTGPTSERNYGLFYPSEQKVYDVPLTLEALASAPTASPSNTSRVVTKPPSTSSSGDFFPSTAGQTWCVASGDVGEEKLKAALDYACGEGAADCRPIQPGATCYNPNTLVAHASYAFNSYYQKNARRSGSCYFGGAAYVVSQLPKYGSCDYPTGY
ncbi:glucan endo-1,3-beta-glucosidase 13-like [Coffea arabica]|uniref:glucan endo-1,3-beta-D-glucosidase n=1 Tax=Coffea arabica TaxID=13443 RepID=A0A6P6V244_COFAR|nr:glucan endo-1,3-beta-glucosidase 13-like [Coffea arabica]